MISLKRIILIVLLSIFIYIFIPYILLNTNYDMWGSFSTTPINYNKNLISLSDIFFSTLILFIFLQFPNFYTNNREIINNKIIYVIVILLLLFYFQFFIDVISKTIYSNIDRNVGAQLWLIHLNNGFNSYIFTAALVFVVSVRDNKNNLLLYTLIVILFIQLLSGMRSEFTRFLIIVMAIIKKRYVYIIIPIILILVLNRQLLFGYNFDIRSIFGDAINVMYGYHLINNIDLPNCNAFNSILRIFVPPPMRKEFFDFSGDLVICLNVNYFEIIGIGNSILTDINKFPIETITMLLIYLLIVYLFPNKYKYLILILALSMIPHIMRLGFITSTSYTISFIIWILIPILILNEFLLKNKL